MKTVKLLHVADLHLDSTFGSLPADKAVLRRKMQRRLLTRLRELVISSGVQLVLIAGDVFDSDFVYAETAETLTRELGAMRVPVFISPGNHDPFTVNSPYAKLELPENVRVFKRNSIECATLPQLGVRVFGAAFTDNHCAPLLGGFTAPERDGYINLMCIHGELAPDSPYNAITESQLAQSGMDYAALGHIHKGSGLKRAGRTYYAWPGCPEGRGFDECGDKSVYITTISDSGCDVEELRVAGGRYEELTVEPGDGDALTAILSALPENTQNDVYRIILRGECAEAPDTASLTAALESRFFRISLTDRTVPRRDIWESASQDSLKGQLLLRLRAAYDAALSDRERELIVRAARWGVAALERREEVR